MTIRSLVMLTFAALASAAAAQIFPNNWTTGDFDYVVNYTSQNPYNCMSPSPGDDLDYVPDDVALDMAQALDAGGSSTPGNPAGYHVGYTNLGFRAPFFAQLIPELIPEVVVYNCAPGSGEDPDCDNGSAPEDTIKMPSTRYCGSTEQNIRRVIGHELFHHVQYAYIDFDDWTEWGRTAVEGTARMMEDQIFADIDGNQSAAFHNQVKNYLDNPNRDFWLASYSAALGWKYAAEQYGTETAEPQLGVDFVRRFWEKAAANEDDPDTAHVFKQTIRDTSNDSLGKWFERFSIANIAREFDASLLANPGQYRYADENDGSGVTYANVKRSFTGAIPGPLVLGTQQVRRWGAAHLETDVALSCSERSILGVRLKGDRIGHAIMAVDTQNRIRHLIRGTSKDVAASFIQRTGDDRYTTLIATLIGKSDFAETDFNFDCGIATLDVRLPDSDYKAYVGPHDEPLEFIVRTTVTGPSSLGNPTVFGLQPSDFEVYVGNNYVFDDEAIVVSGLYVQGEYWLVVRAPAKPDDNTYDLHVNLGPSLTRTQPGAISYEEKIFDQVLTLDTSGSMASPAASPSIDAAINAASLFTDVAGPNDFLGLVTYSGNDIETDDDAVVHSILASATDVHRDTIKGKLDTLVASGFTSIGDGIDRARDEFPAHGSALGEDWIVLLSDGMENEAQYWNDVKGGLAGIRINTIALGPDADQVLLSDIAQATGGQYYYVDTGSLAARSAASAALPNRLADAYASASEIVKKHERLWEFQGTLAASDSTEHTFTVEEGGIVDATFSINWGNPGDSVQVTIVRPDSSAVSDGDPGVTIRTGSTHYVAHLGALAQGTWTVKVSALAGAPDYIGILAGSNRQGAGMKVFFTQYMDNLSAQAVGAQFLLGLPQPIMALLTDRNGVVKNASVKAFVEHPDGTTLVLPLFDDGEHSDGNADDGVYGNLYTRTTVASETDLPDLPGNGVRGSYNVSVQATGTDNLGQNFARIRKGSFQTFDPRDPPSDTDGDHMPDRYEDLHECLDKSDGGDEEADGDDDRIINIEEWRIGTDPCNPDTDFGGESDYSEITRGANPFDPADDALPRPVYVEVINWTLDHLPFPEPSLLQPTTNLIRYPANPAYHRIRLHRSLSPNGPFTNVATFLSRDQHGLYRDEGLTDNTTYYYKIEPEDLNGNLGTPSHVFSGTPKVDPNAPIGSVLIDNGASTTLSLNVDLWLNASPDVTQMMIANDATFSGVAWLPYSAQPSWTLNPTPPGGTATVFVKFRDGALNESETYHDSIVRVNNALFGSIAGNAKLQGAAMHSGILAKIVGQSDVSPGYTAADGQFALTGMSPGTYDVSLSRSGYLPHTLTSVQVVAGSATATGTTVLVAIDTDADGIADIDDNCTLVANPSQRNTDGDAFGNDCDPDLNNDNVINAVDLGLLRAVFFSNDADADFDGNGVVNVQDLGTMKAYFFLPPGPAGLLP